MTRPVTDRVSNQDQMEAVIPDDTELRRSVYAYLDMLRETGVTNMFGAGSYLVRDFEFSRDESHRWLGEWMRDFRKPSPTEGSAP